MLKIAYFAGGCFWCITPAFYTIGALKVISGYSGGDEVNPTYNEVKSQSTGHRETIKIIYDSDKVSYEKLLNVFLDNVDPFDKDGQFIDRGHSYTLAIYYMDEDENRLAKDFVDKLEKDSGKKTYISIEAFKSFYHAEEYHQDYYLKNPDGFKRELIESGRVKA